MKKAILFFAALALLCCLFAFGVSAKTVEYEGVSIPLVDDLGDPEWYTGNTALAIQDKESFVILKDSEGNMTAYPSYYLFRYNVVVVDGAVVSAEITWADKNGVDYSHINDATGKSYESGSIYYVEFPYGITKCMNNSIFGKDADAKPEPNVVEIVIPDSVTTIDQQAFRRMNSCKKITISKNVVNIPSWAFCGSAALETVVFSEGSLLETTGNSFSSCTSLMSINIEACKNLKTLGGSVFSYCTSLRRISLPDSIEKIESQAFYRIGELTLASDYLPKNLTTIGTHFLSGCKLQNSTIYFPAGVTTFDASYHFNDGFWCDDLTLVFLGKMSNINLNNAALVGMTKKLTIILAQNTFSELNGDFVQGIDWTDGQKGYIAKNADGSQSYSTKTDGTLTLSICNNDPNSTVNLGQDANGNTVFRADTAPATIIFCGNDTVEYCYSVRNNNTSGSWQRYFTTSWVYDLDAHKEANKHYVTHKIESEADCGHDGLSTTTCVVCKAVSEAILPATGDHKYADDFDCTTEDVCDVCLLVVKAAQEHALKESLVYGSYFEKGAYACNCENEGCSFKMNKEKDVLFVSKGISAKTFGEDIALVQGYGVNLDAINAYKVYAPDFDFGILAYANNGATEVAPKPGEDKVVDIVFDNMVNDYIEVKLTGIPSEYQDIPLIFCIYATEGDKFYYLDDGMMKESVVGNSYNNIVR